MDQIALSLFSSRIEAVCDEMGAVLRRAAFSPNIKDRLDYSCAVFDRQGELCAQAAHIPVHLGSMAYAMRDLVGSVEWSSGDMLIVNDPYLGGTHLPDVTLIAPVYVQGNLMGFVANRAHHADIGAQSPGSMPISSRLDEEGMIIPPSCLIRQGQLDEAFFSHITNATANPAASRGDFSAQISANRAGLQRLAYLIEQMGRDMYQASVEALNDYGERLARQSLLRIPEGVYQFTDYLDDDGQGNEQLTIKASIAVTDHHIAVDFSGTVEQVPGNVNCPLSVAAAAVYYVFRCLMPAQTPACAGTFRSIKITAPEGCLLNAKRPAAVAAGNVETSSRVVDVVMGALAEAIPERLAAASQGTMNNIAMGARTRQGNWDYYETLGGGMGAHAHASGLSAVQTHMTNTLNTPIEVLEQHYPLRITRYSLRPGSGGNGRYRGGDGMIREYQFLEPAQITLLTERRMYAAWGLSAGGAGEPGVNRLNDGVLGGKVSRQVRAGDVLRIETPGGGGFGEEK